MAQEVDRLDAKFALLGVDGQASRGKVFQDLAHMAEMILERCTCHQNVVQIDERKGEASQHAIHEACIQRRAVAASAGASPPSDNKLPKFWEEEPEEWFSVFRGHFGVRVDKHGGIGKTG